MPVRWDNGSGLNVIYGVDIVRKLDTVTTICCGEKRIWDSRIDAENFFLQAMTETEGSECERYTKIYTELKAGLEVCSDEY